MNSTTFKEFKALATHGNLIPLVTRLKADTETPVSAFLKMTKGPYRFLFESMEGGERWGRYSFLGSEPSLIFRVTGPKMEIIRGRKREKVSGDPFETLRHILKIYHPVHREGVPRLAGGLVGYCAYDMVRWIERLPDLKKPALPFADSIWMLQDSLIVFDNLSHDLEIVVMAYIDPKTSLKKSYEQALKRSEVLAARLNKALPRKFVASKVGPVKSNTQETEFHNMVKRGKEYIKAGDIFQVQLSQRWQAPFHGDPFQVYRELRQINPSPYLFYLQMGDQTLAGSSPEVMVRLEGEKITLRPIAGTRRRGRDEADEIKMRQEMLRDPKEIAEHVMLVDLGRNDVGRVAEQGSVKVTDMMFVEKYSHVMHLVSNIEGKLKAGLDAVDVLKASFPAGTLTGAPKIRAMEIIEELEKEKRGPYGGGVGYLDFYGNMDMAITIRSLAFAQKKVWFQSAGGIVLDSKPELEYLETQNKSKAMREALKRCS